MGVAFLVTMCEKPLIHLLSQQHNLILKSFRKEKLLSFVWREKALTESPIAQLQTLLLLMLFTTSLCQHYTQRGIFDWSFKRFSDLDCPKCCQGSICS